MALLTADWSPLGNHYFRKYELYTMGWPEQLGQLDNFIVAAAPYGGPIALTRDDRKFVKIQAVPTVKRIIFIFTASGQQISSITWHSGQLIHMAWSSSEDLLCIQDDGSVLVYDLMGNYKNSFGMGQEVSDMNILQAMVFRSSSGTGVAVFTTSSRIFLINSIQDRRLRRLAEVPGPDVTPNTWAVVSDDRKTWILLVKDKTVYRLEQPEDIKLANPDFKGHFNYIVNIAVSQNCKQVALFTDTGLVWMGAADLKRKYNEIDTKCMTPPKQLVWCGNKAVVASWDSLFLVIGQGDVIRYPYDSTVFLVPEMDGVRILGSAVHEMIQLVPDVSKHIFLIGSMAPGAILLEASKEFQKRSHRADEYIRMVKDELQMAVTQCIEAAGYEYSATNQKMLMRAAQFGKGFIPNFKPDGYVDMCQTLRILNAVRDYKLGLPLTYGQLKQLTIPVLLDRLVLRQHYYMAILIAKYLKVPDAEGASRILAHWACYKVSQTHLDGDQIARDIAAKLGQAPGISYSEIASKAADAGRKELAIKLLDHETRASKQVTLLVTLGEMSQALLKAIESGDTDLIYTVLLSLRDNMSMGAFQMEIRNYPVAQALYIKYCRDQHVEGLCDVYVQEDDYNSQAALNVQESYRTPRIDSKLASLLTAHDCYKKAKNEFGIIMSEEQHKLLKQQVNLEEKFHQEFREKSLQDTVYNLLLIREVKQAEKLRQDFKMPDKKYWWLRIMAAAELGDWSDLQKFAASKKSPIGYEPFVETCLKHENKGEAEKYLPKVKEDVKVRYYVKVGLFEEAAKIAFEQKDDQALLYVQSKCASTNRELVDKINALKGQLSSKKYRV